LQLKHPFFFQVDKIAAKYFALFSDGVSYNCTLPPSNKTETGSAGEQWFDRAHGSAGSPTANRLSGIYLTYTKCSVRIARTGNPFSIFW
jgi:hypothetical protein